MTDLPEPLTPADCELREYPFTPMFRSRLFGSSFHAKANDAEWRAGVTLWLKSWDQAPAGSLPDDDVDLCRLAEFGRDQRTWKKVKAMALHGWVKCSDGRLYHPVVAEGVLEAWEGRRKQSSRGKAGAEARWRKRDDASNAAANAPATAASTAPANGTSMVSDGASMPQAMLADGNREGQGEGEPSVPIGTGARAPARLFPELERTPPARPSAPTSDPDEAVIPLYLVVVGEGNHSKALFGHGLAFVRRVTRKGENEARTLIGKWRSSLRNDDKRLWELLVSADRVEGGVADLPSWIGARLRAGPPGARSSEPDDGLTPTARAIIADQNARREAEKGAA